MQLCNLTYELATLGQEKSRRSRYLTQINFQLFKNTASQINAICDLQEDKVSLDEAVVEIQDTNGDKIAIAKFVLELKE